MSTLLTFLGTGRYETVTYTGRAGQHSLRIFFLWRPTSSSAPEKVVVFLTPQARQHQNFRDLQSQLQEKLQPVDIPEGRSQADLWEIFERVAGAVRESDTVILDITHAFRSIPMVVLAVAAYLRRTKSVTIELHRLRRLRSPRAFPHVAPAGEIARPSSTSRRSSSSWTGPAAPKPCSNVAMPLIAAKMIETHQRLWTKQAETSQKPTKLKLLGQRLQSLSKALHLSRPREVMPLSAEPVIAAERCAVGIPTMGKAFRTHCRPDPTRA